MEYTERKDNIYKIGISKKKREQNNVAELIFKGII